MTWYDLKNPYWIGTYAFIWLQTNKKTSYPSQIPTWLQEQINEPITQEELIDSTDSDIPNLIYIPKEVLFQNYLLPPLVWAHSDDAS